VKFNRIEAAPPALMHRPGKVFSHESCQLQIAQIWRAGRIAGRALRAWRQAVRISAQAGATCNHP
jgi:hypothetical protein